LALSTRGKAPIVRIFLADILTIDA